MYKHNEINDTNNKNILEIENKTQTKSVDSIKNQLKTKNDKLFLSFNTDTNLQKAEAVLSAISNSLKLDTKTKYILDFIQIKSNYYITLI